MILLEIDPGSYSSLGSVISIRGEDKCPRSIVKYGTVQWFRYVPCQKQIAALQTPQHGLIIMQIFVLAGQGHFSRRVSPVLSPAVSELRMLELVSILPGSVVDCPSFHLGLVEIHAPCSWLEMPHPWCQIWLRLWSPLGRVAVPSRRWGNAESSSYPYMGIVIVYPESKVKVES